MKKRAIIIIAILSVITAVISAFLIIHRNVIKALIKGEELPELPEGHPECCAHKKLEDKHSKCCAHKKLDMNDWDYEDELL